MEGTTEYLDSHVPVENPIDIAKEKRLRKREHEQGARVDANKFEEQNKNPERDEKLEKENVTTTVVLHHQIPAN